MGKLSIIKEFMNLALKFPHDVPIGHPSHPIAQQTRYFSSKGALYLLRVLESYNPTVPLSPLIYFRACSVAPF